MGNAISAGFGAADGRHEGVGGPGQGGDRPGGGDVTGHGPHTAGELTEACRVAGDGGDFVAAGRGPRPPPGSPPPRG